jgi:hypothetical protein
MAILDTLKKIFFKPVTRYANWKQSVLNSPWLSQILEM